MNAEQRRKTCGYLMEAVSVLTAMSETAQGDGCPELAASLAETAQAYRQERFRISLDGEELRPRSDEPAPLHNTYPRGRYTMQRGQPGKVYVEGGR